MPLANGQQPIAKVMNKETKIYIAGHRGMVGSAVLLNLQANGYTNLITRDLEELDLTRQKDVEDFFAQEQPEFVIIAAAKVGGILANSTYPWEFLYENLMIECNIINAAHKNNVQNLIFLGSSCIYPKMAPQPLKEEYLLTGPLEPTNEWYAIAKIAGIKLCQALNKQYGRNYISLMPTNLYGPRDNFDLETSHVLPAMIRKFHEAKMNDHAPVTLWGTGTPKREFLYVEDLAEAIKFFMEFKGRVTVEVINVGSGVDLSIKELAETIQKITKHKGKVIWDVTKPDGTGVKLLNVEYLESNGWRPQINLQKGIRMTYKWFTDSILKNRGFDN